MNTARIKGKQPKGQQFLSFPFSFPFSGFSLSFHPPFCTPPNSLSLSRGNPSDFNWPPNSICPPPPPPPAVMEMNLDSGGNSSFLNLNHWEQQSSAAADPHDAHFESALSSLVSSPTSPSSSPAAGCNIPPDSIVIRELIGRLGSICNNNHCNSRGSLTPHVINYQCSNDNNTSSSSSCYTTPLSSPPKLNLISFPQFPPPPMGAGLGFVTDPGFAERAARYSCFGVAGNYAQFGEPGKLSRASSSQSLSGQLENNMMLTRMRRTTTLMAKPGGESGLNINNGDPRDDSSPSDPIMTPCESEVNVIRKRKATFSSSSSSRRSKGNDARHNPPKASEEENANSKRCKSSSGEERPEADKDAVKAPKVEQNNSAAEKQNEKDKESNAKPPEPPKQDYIHVRARRGQATDSHSLAERVRREKISERMKFLQDLVPGCNKVTGKAVMLDEIINYVQSLQRQVEFLSMKLATVNPLVDSVLTKDVHQPRGLMLLPHSSYQLEAMGSSGFSYANLPAGHGPPLQSRMASNALETELDASMQAPSFDGFTDATSASQLGAFWEDDLHSVVQMGFVQNQEAAFSSQNLQGSPSHSKIEL